MLVTVMGMSYKVVNKVSLQSVLRLHHQSLAADCDTKWPNMCSHVVKKYAH